VIGFVKGTGMGLMGFVLKNLSAILGPFGYTLKGFAKQYQRRNAPRKLIRRSRIAQGQRDVASLDWDERRRLHREVVEAWQIMEHLAEEILQLDKHGGIPGHSERVLQSAAPMFESVETASRSLRRLQKGEPLEQVLQSLDHVVRPDKHGNQGTICGCRGNQAKIKADGGEAKGNKRYQPGQITNGSPNTPNSSRVSTGLRRIQTSA
jgi:hypothetical protein